MVNFDLRELLNSLVGVVDDVTAESADLSAALESSRQAFSAFTLSYIIYQKPLCVEYSKFSSLGMTLRGVELMQYSARSSIPCFQGNGGHVIMAGGVAVIRQPLGGVTGRVWLW